MTTLNNSKNKLIIVVTSKNNMKLNAVKRAFQNKNMDVNVIGFNIKSDVPNQPLFDQTILGAYNRIKNLELLLTEENILFNFIVSMENGIDIINNKALDYCYIIIKNNKKEIIELKSKLIEIPTEYVNESIKNRQEKTAGYFYETSKNINDWHKYHCGISREDIIYETLLKMF
jgi:non-canonical (house-cleaning) NTP pyrophosphatase